MSKLSTTTSFGGAALLVLACTLTVASPAAAAPLDIPVTTPGELVQAITDTNTNPGPDTIRISGTLVLTVDLPPITDDLTVIGDGPATTIVDGDQFQQTFTAQGTGADLISVSISGLTVTQRGSLGGAISAYYANLTVDEVVTSNSYVGIAVREGSATVTNSTAKDNSFAGVSLLSEDGDSVYSFSGMTTTGNGSPGLQASLEGDSSLTVTDSVSSGNDRGYYIYEYDAARAELDGVRAIDNGDRGVSVVLEGDSTFTLSRSTVEGNTNGGVRFAGDDLSGSAGSAATIVSTTVRANGTETTDGGGILVSQPYGLTVDIASSTISDNTANSGGGIFNSFADSDGPQTLHLTVVDSTVSGNVGETVGGVYVNGGNLSADSTVSILNSTITANTVKDAGPAGAALIGYFTPVIHNSIVAGNIDVPGEFGDLDLFGIDSDLDVAYSLIGVPSSAASAKVAAGTGNLTGVDPKLGPLADNGGPTLTHLLLDGSPAINAGDPAFTGLTADQRGLTRVVGVLDMGAVETQPALAVTGADAAVPLAGGVLLLGVGGLLLLARRRRSAR